MKKKESLGLEKPNFNSLITLLDAFSDIKFFEKDHHYEINGVRAKKSVSQLIKKYEKPFEKEKIASHIARRDGKPVEVILDEWKYNGDYSCHKGSEFHLMVENFYERRTIPIDKQAAVELINKSGGNNNLENYYTEMALLIKNFRNFYDWWKQDHILLKSEFVIGDKEKKVCGTIDNLSFNKKTGKLVLFDYKTNKEIKTKGYKDEMLLKPFDHIPNCELSKYSIQLLLYKLIIERNSPFEVGECNIVWVAGKEDYELINIIDLEKEAKHLLDNV
jgi:hypothetical protein